MPLDEESDSPAATERELEPEPQPEAEPQPEPRFSPRARRGLVVGAVVLLVVVVVFAFGRGGPSRVDDARKIVDDDAQFETATEAGVAFVRVAELLQEEGEACRPRESEKCGEFYSGAAFAQITAVNVLRCTRPGVFEARAEMRRFLKDLSNSAGQGELDPPVPPTC